MNGVQYKGETKGDSAKKRMPLRQFNKHANCKGQEKAENCSCKTIKGEPEGCENGWNLEGERGRGRRAAIELDEEQEYAADGPRGV